MPTLTRAPMAGDGAMIASMVTEDDVRRIAVSLPSTTEKPSYGTPGFRVKDKLFARIHDAGEAVVVWCADLEDKEALLASDPAKFTTTPHYDGHPMVLAQMAEVDTDELIELLTDAWRVRAPTRVRKAFEDERAGAWTASDPGEPCGIGH